jgi:Uma2 family endonuclease
MAQTVQTGMPLQEFVARYEEAPFELIEGTSLPVSPSAYGPTRIANRLARWINEYAESRGLGEAFVEAVFILTMPEDKNWVKGSRVPDVLFVGADKLAAYYANNPTWETDPLMLVPDLVVEVISPTDNFTKVKHKVATYLNDGVRLIWVIDPERRTVLIPSSEGAAYRVLSEEETLTGDDVLPGFSLDVAKLFA